MGNRSVVMPTLPRDMHFAVRKRRELQGRGRTDDFEVIIETAPGLANATKLGVDASDGEVVVVMDCDALHPAYMATILVHKLESEGYDLVKGSRINFGRGLRGLLSAWGNRLIRRALGLEVSECGTAMETT